MHWCHLVIQFLALVFSVAIGGLSLADVFSKKTVNLFDWRSLAGAETAAMLFLAVTYFTLFWRPPIITVVAQKLAACRKSPEVSPSTKGKGRSRTRGSSRAGGESDAVETSVAIAQDEASELMAQCASGGTVSRPLVSALLTHELASAVIFYGALAVLNAFGLAVVVFLYTEADRSVGYMATINSAFDSTTAPLDYLRIVKLLFLLLQVVKAATAVGLFFGTILLRMVTRKVVCEA